MIFDYVRIIFFIIFYYIKMNFIILVVFITGSKINFLIGAHR